MYKLYGLNKQKRWEKIDTKNDLKEIISISLTLTAKEYYGYEIYECNSNGNILIIRENLFEKCTVEFVEEVKTTFEVKVTTFEPSRIKIAEDNLQRRSEEAWEK